MNKKILIIGIFVVFIMLAIAFASTVTSDNSKTSKKVSPLFGIRTRRAIREKIGDFIRRYIGQRVFFLPFRFLFEKNDLSVRQWLQGKTEYTNPTCGCSSTCDGAPTCVITICQIECWK
jgi:hypothetical protein